MSKLGPFGLNMGMSLTDLEGELDEIGPNRYVVKLVPKPHPAFELYIVDASKRFGIYRIRAVSPTIQTNAFGADLIGTFQSLRERFGNAYGQHENYDFVMHDSIWNEPRDWMHGLMSKERFLSAVWSKKHGSVVEAPLESIHLTASAIDTSSGFVAVEYLSERCETAEAELAAIHDDVL